MLDLDAINQASRYSLDALRALSASQIDGLCFSNFPEKHGGYDALDALFPKAEKYGKLDPPAS